MSRAVPRDAGRLPGAESEQELAGIDMVISHVLRWGVLAAAAVIVAGVVLFIAQAGVRAILLAPPGIPPGSETDPRSLRVVLDNLIPPQPVAVTDAGLLLLIITPVISVAISVAAFAVRRDWLYVWIAAFVFAMLMISFAVGRA